jgi:hypothetical protein
VGRIWCSCGHSFSDSDIPCLYQYSLIPDEKIEELTETIIDRVNENEDAEVRVGFLLLDTGCIAYKCPNCSGMLIFWDGHEKKATYYNKQ